MTEDTLREQLNAPDAAARRAALEALMDACAAGRAPCAPPNRRVNMHCHTIFSYNGYGHSPASLAWLARREGWHALATVDFDVLDGLDETLWAGDRAGVRVATGLETRVYVPEFAAREINSPGEPGVFYFAGLGFTTAHLPVPAAAVLADMRRRAAERNRDVVARVNAYLAPVAIDYDRDVLPLTPSGNATERHLLVAYDVAARRAYPEREALLAFWGARLGLPAERVGAFMGDEPFPHDAIRSKLMKRGGPGYVEPGPETFPSLATVAAAITAGGGLPIWTWLDGLSEGERAADELADLLLRHGAAGLNIIPDRNWNLPDPAERERKIAKMNEIIALARALDLPVIVGTEMNKAGQKLVDDFEAEPLRPWWDEFVRGADFVYGHTALQRALDRGYGSAWARQHLPGRRERNAFYSAAGAALAPGAERLAALARCTDAAGPDALLARIERG